MNCDELAIPTEKKHTPPYDLALIFFVLSQTIENINFWTLGVLGASSKMKILKKN